MFTPIDVDEVWEELQLGEQAVRFGEKNLPGRNDVELDGPQKQLQQLINKAINDAYRRANVELERLSSAFRERDIERLVDELRQAPSKAEERIARQTDTVDAKVAELEEERDRERARIARYRKRYEIERGPDLKDPVELKVLLIATIGLALVQAGVNTVFFAQGIRWGLAAGLGLAFVLGLSDVLIHYWIGRLGSRLHAPRFVDRLLGVFMTALAVGTIPLWNLGIVHLRNGVRLQGFAEGVEQWGPSLLNDPLGFTDFMSWALLAIGTVCSISAAATGWKWDEPIPLFRSAGRKLRDIELDLRDLDRYRAGIEHRAKDALQETMAEIRQQIEFNLEASAKIVGRMERLRGNLSVFVRDAASAFNTLVQKYRDENRAARSTEPPGYFHRPAEIDTRQPLDLDMSELNERLAAQRKLWQRMQDDTSAPRPSRRPTARTVPVAREEEG